MKRVTLFIAMLAVAISACSHTSNMWGEVAAAADSVPFPTMRDTLPTPREDVSMVVIDGIVLRRNICISPDSADVATHITSRYPFIKGSDIAGIQIIPMSEMGIVCSPQAAHIILVTTKPERGIDTIMLNGKLSVRKKKIALGHFVDLWPNSYSRRFLEKKWGLSDIRFIQIHPEGIEVTKEARHQSQMVFVEIHTR